MYEFFMECLDFYDKMFSQVPREWRNHHEVGAILLFIATSILAVLPFVGAWVGLKYGLRHAYSWVRRSPMFRRTMPCQHHQCKHTPTKLRNHDGQPGCVAGGPCCEACHKRHKDEFAKRRTSNEPTLNCPEFPNHGPMRKEILKGDLVAHRCTSCNCMYVSGREMRLN